MKKLHEYKKKLNNIAELGWNEKLTTTYIFQTLLPLKPIKKGFGKEKTGLLYKVGKGRDAILLRADIDALQTQDGAKHICGHSSHTAALMQTLQETIKQENEFTKQNKSIYFLFQPCEENYPSGAKAFLTEIPTILPNISYAFAAHVKPLMKLGEIGLIPGNVWARGDYMEIKIFGKMVHVKDTPEGIDALEIAARFILYVKQLQKRYINNLRINIGVAKGGLQANTVADFALLKGDIRLKRDSQQKKIKEHLFDYKNKMEKQYHVKINLNYFDGYPVVVNNTKLTNEITGKFIKTPQWKIVSDDSLFSFGCEDFCFIAEKIPSVMALIGTGDKYDIHEAKCTISDKGTEAVYQYFSEITNWWLSKTKND